jgi:hypothetical protein
MDKENGSGCAADAKPPAGVVANLLLIFTVYGK